MSSKNNIFSFLLTKINLYHNDIGPSPAFFSIYSFICSLNVLVIGETTPPLYYFIKYRSINIDPRKFFSILLNISLLFLIFLNK